VNAHKRATQRASASHTLEEQFGCALVLSLPLRMSGKGIRMTRRIDLTAQTWHALETLSWETERPLNELAEEAFSDLFEKRRRPRSLREALRDAARPHPLAGYNSSLRKRG
jgi:hypothetical protein